MSQQEMSFEDSRYEQSHDVPPRISGQYGQYHQYNQSAQKLRPRTLSKRTAMRIQLWTAYISLFLAMVLSFLLGGRDWSIGIDIIPMTFGGLLLTCYVAIVAFNILVFILVNFKVSVTRKPIQ